jgi:hypothetical protein
MIAERQDIVDYKMFCFGGEPRVIMNCSERTLGLKADFFDAEWNHLPFTRKFPLASARPPRPEALPELLRLARILSAGFIFLRVDCHIIGDRVLIGELTLYPGNGMQPFSPVGWIRRPGDWIKLPASAVIIPRPPTPPVKIPRADLAALLVALENFPAALPSTEVTHLAHKIKRIPRSFSWHATAPFRTLRRALTRARHTNPQAASKCA